MLCRSLCDDLAHLGATGEEDEVERPLEEAGISLAAASHHCDRLCFEIARDQPEQHLRRALEGVAHCQDAGVAGGKRGDCGPK
jgi:hypothetical protein